MDNSEHVEPPLITAIRLARMRDGNMGQAEEIQSLIDILKGSENIMKIINDTVWSLIQKKKGMSLGQKQLLFEESFKILTDGIEKFVDAKTKRISNFINYFQLMKQDVTEEYNKLQNFEKEWDTIKQELSNFNMDSIINTHKENSINQTNYFKNNVLQTALPILEKLTQLENQMQKRVLNMIAFIAQANTTVDTNQLYKLLTAER